MISRKKLMEGHLKDRILYLRVPYNRLNPVLEAEMLKEILDTLPQIKTQRDVANHLNWPESTVSIHFKLLDGLDPDIREYLKDMDETPTASELYRVSRMDRKEQLSWFADLTLPSENG